MERALNCGGRTIPRGRRIAPLEHGIVVTGVLEMAEEAQGRAEC
jgi:hypothetical protein